MDRNCIFIISVLAVSCCLLSCTGSKRESVETKAFFSKIKGTWKLEDRNVYELWRFDGDSGINALVCSIQNTDTIVNERIKIVEYNSGIFSEAVVADQNDAQPVRFKLVKSEIDILEFRNPDHDFPQKISYTLTGETRLKAVISGKRNGEIRTIEYVYARINSQ